MTDKQKEAMRLGRAKKKAEKEALKNSSISVFGMNIKKNGDSEVPEQNSVFIDLSSKMDKMVEGLNSVGSAVLKLVEIQSHSTTVSPVSSTTSVPDQFTPKLDDETYPKSYIPPKFRKIVDTILSEEFGLRVFDFEDRTDFQIDVTVPERFSSVSKEDKEKGVQDIRTRIIPRALGENGVREWCELIRRNLNKFYQKEGVQSPFKSAL